MSGSNFKSFFGFDYFDTVAKTYDEPIINMMTGEPYDFESMDDLEIIRKYYGGEKEEESEDNKIFHIIFTIFCMYGVWKYIFHPLKKNNK